ncbi:MAG: helix-turn-helix domain-containing protein, partial [Sulfurovum sp.]
MTHEALLNLINLGEDNEIEFKSAKGGLPKSMWDTVSAFANTNGGYIILGVDEDNGEFAVGSLKNSSALVKNFWDLHNSAQKLSTPLCREDDISILEIDGSEIVVIHIPVANRTQRPVFINGNPYTGTYKRNNEGDYRCTKSEIKQMMRDATDEPQDFTIVEGFTLDDIDTETLSAYKNRFSARQGDHPYLALSNKDFLIKLGG